MQRLELLCAFRPGLVVGNMSYGECILPVLQQLLPRVMGVVLAGKGEQVIPHLSSKHGQGRAELGDRINYVSVREDCFVKRVYIVYLRSRMG